MKFGALLLVSAIASWPAFAQQSSPPQRTIATRPDGTVTADQKLAASGVPSDPAAAVEQYRQAWEKMTPAQHRALVGTGGLTPDQFERMMLGRKSAPAKGANPPSSPDSRVADSGALDALSKSLQDLNAVRDANLSLVQKDGCAPELASRIADLKARLRNDEFELNGTEAPPAAAPTNVHSAEKANAADPLVVASDWFRHPADPKQAARPDESGHTRESSLLDAVLTGAQAPPSPRRFDPKSPEAEQNRKEIEADMARVKSELEQLSGACAAAKK